MAKERQEGIFLTHTIIKIGGEMSICTILVLVLCNIYQFPLETVVLYIHFPTRFIGFSLYFLFLNPIRTSGHIYSSTPTHLVMLSTIGLMMVEIFGNL